MAALRQRPKTSTKQKTKQKQKLNPKQITDQRLSTATKQKLEQIFQELATDIELEEDTLLIDESDQENIKEEEEWNEDYGLPLDEYESGEKEHLYSDDSSYIQDIVQSLEQFSIKFCSGDMDKLNQFMEDIAFFHEYGYLPEKSDEKLKAELLILETSFSYQKSTNYPVFKVIVENGRIDAYVINDIIRRIKFSSNKYAGETNSFIKSMHERQSLLENFAKILLEDMQRDFFLQDTLESALLNLLPIPPITFDKSEDESPKLYIESSLNLDKQYISKLSDHSVECDFGSLPLSLFMQNKKPILKQWLEYAEKNNVNKVKDQKEWIKNQIIAKSNKWDSSDKRHDFIKTLIDITDSDIKNARRNR